MSFDPERTIFEEPIELTNVKKKGDPETTHFFDVRPEKIGVEDMGDPENVLRGLVQRLDERKKERQAILDKMTEQENRVKALPEHSDGYIKEMAVFKSMVVENAPHIRALVAEIQETEKNIRWIEDELDAMDKASVKDTIDSL